MRSAPHRSRSEFRVFSPDHEAEMNVGILRNVHDLVSA